MALFALDIGAHWGEVGLPYAFAHPDTEVYAFEPDVRCFARLYAAAPNYHLIPAAVDDNDGWAWLYLNRVPGCSSLHRLDLAGLARWPGGMNFAEVGRVLVPTTRLDTFMARMGIETVEFLKIDTQAHDLQVLHSLGNRLTHVKRIATEVNVSDTTAYQQEVGPREMMEVLEGAGFKMVGYESQTKGYEEIWTFEHP